MKCIARAAAALSLVGTFAHADDLRTASCNWLDRLAIVPEPWEAHTRTFYGGKVRVILADAMEPACCSVHLLILMPNPEEEMAGRQCVAVNMGEGMGFSTIDFEQLTADYDPLRGLTIRLPYRLFDGNESGPLMFADLLVNLAKGTVTVD